MLILVRHGRTNVNAGARLQGRMDAELDELGVRQARAAGEHLRVRFPDARIVTSPLVRAVDTAMSIGASAINDERFIELDYGEWDGLELSKVPGDQWQEWRRNPHFRPPGGETLVELDERVRPALEELSEEARTSDIVIVSHVSPIKSAVTWALGTGPGSTWRMSLDRASICTISIGPNGPALVSFNETGHLGRLRG
ncbi:MAG: hypothetical protein RI912_671 [Actinomycetota bacterium]|jgi:probable phosphoglycerate mutase